MKAYQKDGKIVFKSAILQSIYLLNKIVDKIENKEVTLFPHHELSEFFKICSRIQKEAVPINLPKEFLEHIKENKDVVNFFMNKEQIAQKIEKSINSRQDLFKEYKEDIMDLTNLLD